jgi:YtcA family
MIKGGCSSFPTFLALVVLSGCSSTLEIGGAYFPAWLLSTLIGWLLAAIVRLGLFRAGIDSWIQPRATAYPCLALFFILLTYYLFFRS